MRGIILAAGSGTRLHPATLDLERYRAIEYDSNSCALLIEERTTQQNSRYAVTGSHLYDASVVERARLVQPLAHGELEITDLDNACLREGALNIELMGFGMILLDTGSDESLMDAALLFRTIGSRQCLNVACPDEIVYWLGIDAAALRALGAPREKTGYGRNLGRIADERIFE